jgi:hypothetical protein
MTDERRAAYVSGLRKLADILERHPEVELPYTGTNGELTWILTGDSGHKAQQAAIARALPGTVRKGVRGDAFDLRGENDGLGVLVIADRDEVCERVVVGTETVTEERPDPEALAALPTVTVTEEREVVEWRCGSLLSGAGTGS